MSENVEAEYVNITEACKISGMGQTIVRAAISQGDLKAFHVGRAIRFRRDDVRAWIETKAAA